MSDRMDFMLVAADETKLSCYVWPCERARAAVVVVHGMAEHAARYGRFAGALNDAGYSVWSLDLRGHGATAAGGIKGWFAKKDGWRAVLADIRQFCQYVRERNPGLPLVLFGHSMGSIFARAAAETFGDFFAAVVLSGVTVDIPVRRSLAPVIAGAASLLQGGDKPSPMLDELTFGAFNKPFAHARTRFEWLSRDPAEVDKYVADENCGFICTGSMFVDISKVLLFTLKKTNVGNIPKGVPILIVSGAEDPAGMCGQAARFLLDQYRGAGLKAEAKVYEGARHELLNETNRDEVTADIAAFLDRALAGG